MYILHAHGIDGNLRGSCRAKSLSSEVGRRIPKFSRAIVKRAIDRQAILNSQIAAIRAGRVVLPDESKTRRQKVREYAEAFREIILENYDRKCALCPITLEALLVCSHIVPWAQVRATGLLPTNAILLCALHDRLFDRRLISFSDNGQLLISPALTESGLPLAAVALSLNQSLRAPKTDPPAVGFLGQHRKGIFSEA